MVLTKVLKCKIHGATVTDANVEYEGSITIDRELMTRAGLVEYELVHVWNVTRGSRLVTYAIPGDPGSGTICLNGAAALLNATGDRVIIASFIDVDEESLASHHPVLLFMDEHNGIARAEGRNGQRS